MIRDVTNVTCAACGLVCEDIALRIEDGAVVAVEGACALCESQLMGRTADEGESIDLQPAIKQAAEILSTARAPLIYGLAESTVETQRAAVELADHLGATIDPAIPDFHRAAITALQSVGVSTCTLGEVRQRADVVVFWGADPAATHPRFYERIIDPPRKFVPPSRYVISVGENSSKNRADEFVQVNSCDTVSALSTLRAVAAGIDVNSGHIGEASFDQLCQLAAKLRQANYSIFIFGPDVGGVAELESLFLVVRQLNLQSRSAVLGLGGTLCENVLTWQTGYPCGVSFALGYPRYDPYAYSANTLLERGEVDAVLLVGSEGLDELSDAAKKNLAALPVILLENAGTHGSLNSTVRLTTGLPGVHCGGTVFRMDGVPLPLLPVFDSPLPTSAGILTAIQQGVAAQCA